MRELAPEARSARWAIEE